MQENDWVKNPFSTTFWASGVLPFQSAEEDALLERLLQHIQQCARCQITGPHGSGKSTLLLELLNHCKKQGENVQYLFFNDQNRQMPSDVLFPENVIFFVDGFEQLSYYHRCRLLFRVKRLVLTIHHPIWFVPILYRTQPQFTVFAEIVNRLTAGETDLPIPLEESVLRTIFEQSGKNFRSAFFELYDRWENARNFLAHQ